MLTLKDIKSILCISLTILVLAACNNGQEHGAQNKNAFRATLDKHLNAIKNRDLEQLRPTVAESVTMISPRGDKMDSKEVFMDFHKNWFALDNWTWEGKILRAESTDSMGYGLIQYDFIQSDSLGNIALKDTEYLVLIFKNFKDGWQLVHDQNTRIEDIQKQ